jgi:hypothetical protein
MKHTILLTLLPGVLLLTACNDGNYKPNTVDQHFGLAYKQVTQAQILNPQAAQNPPLDPPKKMDGYAGQNTIDTFREGYSNVEETQSININMGGNGGGGSSGGN